MSDDPHEFAAQRVGTMLRGKYRLEALLGVGGMAAVYRATHRNGHRIAIKMLHPQLSISADVCARFLKEGYVANAIDHDVAVTRTTVRSDVIVQPTVRLRVQPP